MCRSKAEGGRRCGAQSTNTRKHPSQDFDAIRTHTVESITSTPHPLTSINNEHGEWDVSLSPARIVLDGRHLTVPYYLNYTPTNRAAVEEAIADDLALFDAHNREPSYDDFSRLAEARNQQIRAQATSQAAQHTEAFQEALIARIAADLPSKPELLRQQLTLKQVVNVDEPFFADDYEQAWDGMTLPNAA